MPNPRIRWIIYRIVAIILFASIVLAGAKWLPTAVFVLGLILIAVFEHKDSQGRPSRLGIPLNEDGSFDLRQWPFQREKKD